MQIVGEANAKAATQVAAALLRMAPSRQDAQDMQLGFARCTFEAGAASDH
jgi:hypothetical protein